MSIFTDDFSGYLVDGARDWVAAGWTGTFEDDDASVVQAGGIANSPVYACTLGQPYKNVTPTSIGTLRVRAGWWLGTTTGEAGIGIFGAQGDGNEFQFQLVVGGLTAAAEDPSQGQIEIRLTSGVGSGDVVYFYTAPGTFPNDGLYRGIQVTWAIVGGAGGTVTIQVVIGDVLVDTFVHTIAAPGYTGSVSQVFLAGAPFGGTFAVGTGFDDFEYEDAAVVASYPNKFGPMVDATICGRAANTDGSVTWPVILADNTFLVFSGSYLGNGQPLRYDTDGNLVQSYPYSPARFPLGMMGMTAKLADNACLQDIADEDVDPADTKPLGMLWLGGHYSPDAGPIQPGVLPIKIDTGNVLDPVVSIPAPGEVDLTAGFTIIDSAYPAVSLDPTDQGLPPKPSVSCGPISNLHTPTPNPGCNAGGQGFTPVFTGPSGTVPSASDPSGEETLTGKSEVFVDVDIAHTAYPAETVEHLRYALVELDDDTRKEGRVESIGDVEHGLSDPQGNLESASINISIMDADGEPIGSRMLSADLKYFTRDEVLVQARSDRGRRSDAIPRRIGRGLCYGESYGGERVAQLTAIDPIFVDGGSFSPDKTMPQYRYPLSAYPNAPADIAGYYIPIIIGEVSDNGAIDPSTGLLNERGKCPGRFLGVYDGWGVINNNLFACAFIDALYGSDCGGLGCYGRLAISDGKKPASTISLDGTSDFGVIPGGGWAQLILYTENGKSEHRITKVNIAAHSVKVEGFIDPAVLVGDVNWYISRIDYLPRRVKIDITARDGDDVIVPGWSAGPLFEDVVCAEGTFRLVNYRVRGVLLAMHLSGEVTLATNTGGIESMGDGTGTLISDYYTAYNWWLDNCVHRQVSIPPIAGLWPQVEADLPAWGDGWTKTKQSDFAAAQTRSAAAVGGAGLQVAAYFDEGISLRDAMQLWNDNGGCRTYIDAYGRIGVWLLDEDEDPTAWPRADHVSRVFGGVRRWRALDEAMNVVRGGVEWDPDAREFKVEDVSVSSTEAITRNKGISRRSKHYDGKLLANRAHFEYLLGRTLWLQQDGPIYVTLEQCDIGMLDYAVGSGIQATSVVLPGGEATTYWLVILKQTFHVDSHTVSLLCLEVGNTTAAVQGDTILIPPGTGQDFLVTDDDDEAPLVSDDNTEAPMVAA